MASPAPLCKNVTIASTIRLAIRVFEPGCNADLNVVLARRLWPRSIVQPPLTEADRASMALQALQNQRRPEQHVEVTFDDREPAVQPPAGTPQTPEEVAPPADARIPVGRAEADKGRHQIDRLR